jgi:hypothetical protein
MGYSGPPPIPTELRSGVADPNDPTNIIFEFVSFQARSTARGGAQGATSQPDPNQISGGGVIDAHLQNDDSIIFTIRNANIPRGRANLGRAKMAGDVKTLETESRAIQQRTATRSGRGAVAPTPSQGRGGPGGAP